MAILTKDIEDMLDYLNLDAMSKSLNEKIRSPEYASYNPIQLIREIVSEEFTYQLNNNTERSLRLARLKGSNAQIEQLKSGHGRLYQDQIIKQLSTLEFISDRQNIAVFGESGVGKTFFYKSVRS